MEHRLTDEEISLLKELKGAGERGRNFEITYRIFRTFRTDGFF